MRVVGALRELRQVGPPRGEHPGGNGDGRRLEPAQVPLEQGELQLYTPMMKLIGAHGGNVSSEHGVGTLKRAYLSMSRTPSDIAAMRAIKAAFDPDGYLNAAVLFG